MQGQGQGQGPSLQGPGQGQGLDLQGQGLCLDSQGPGKDKDLNLVLKESLRTRTRINITAIDYTTLLSSDVYLQLRVCVRYRSVLLVFNAPSRCIGSGVGRNLQVGAQCRRKAPAEIFLMMPPHFSLVPPHEGAHRLFVTDYERQLKW